MPKPVEEMKSVTVTFHPVSGRARTPLRADSCFHSVATPCGSQRTASPTFQDRPRRRPRSDHSGFAKATSTEANEFHYAGYFSIVVNDLVAFGDQAKGEGGDKGEHGKEKHLEGCDAEARRGNEIRDRDVPSRFR